MKRFISNIVFCLLIVALVIFLLTFELQTISNQFLIIFWNNLKSISTALYILIPLILLSILILLLLTNRWALRVEKMSIGGFSIIFDNPTHLYKRQVKYLLDTKRTVFKIDYMHDNFSETLDSYFEIYKFFRDEIKILGNVSKKKYANKDAQVQYELTSQATKILNNFLTENQNNYRRWYHYIEKKDEEKYYLTPIGELQKEYPHYKELCLGFEKVNGFFIDKIAKEFEVDIGKWE